MNMNESNVNEFFGKYVTIVDNICDKHQYHPNIRHLLYIIVPAFIIKYGIKNEQMIINCFENVKIYTTNNKDGHIQAYFTRKLTYEESQYKIQKYIVLNNFFESPYISVIDSVVHELNHAINSINNEIKYDEEFVYLRTGLSYIKYNKSNLKEAIDKSKDYSLEEIINTKQTEEIFTIIIGFSEYNIDNTELKNVLFSLKTENGMHYSSDAYFLQSYICKELIKNKTFLSTIENLRFIGEVNDINFWFNNITGKENSYEKMISLLDEVINLEYSYSKTKWFKNRKIRKIRSRSNEIKNIVLSFENACVYK